MAIILSHSCKGIYIYQYTFLVKFFHYIGLTVQIKQLSNESFHNVVLTISTRPSVKKQQPATEHKKNSSFIKVIKRTEVRNFSLACNQYCDSLYHDNREASRIQDLKEP